MTSVRIPECTQCEYCDHKVTSTMCKVTFTSMRCIHPDSDDNPNPTIGRAPHNCPIIKGWNNGNNPLPSFTIRMHRVKPVLKRDNTNIVNSCPPRILPGMLADIEQSTIASKAGTKSSN